MKRIGVTINLDSGLFSNGVNQNAIYLANLLKEIGYSVYLIYSLDKELEDIAGIKIINFKKAWNIPFDLIIQLGATCEQPIFDMFKKKKKDVKLVVYECGNKFIMDMEAIMFKPEEDYINSIRTKPHQIWSIPQMENTNIDYYRFLNRQEKATVVPFIWEPLAIEDVMKDNGYDVYTKRDINRIGVLEPNRSVMKNILFPIMALENYYNKYKDIDQVILYASEKIKHAKTFISTINKLKLVKDGKIFANPRENTVDVVNKSIDLILSWQWENNLNYLWLDVAWMGWPIVHNGSLCQDIGYYYEEFNSRNAVNMIKYAIENHNDDIEYLNKNRKIIERYTHKNEKLKEQYKMLVENVLNNRFEEYSYNWKTNSISK